MDNDDAAKIAASAVGTVTPSLNKRLKRAKKAGNRTVTFGDASAVRSNPAWAVVGAIFVFATWYLSTRPWGFPQDFAATLEEGLTDKKRYSACELSDACETDDYFQLVTPLVFPSPSDTYRASVSLFAEGYKSISLWEHTWASLWRVIRGMTVGSIVGIPLGLGMGLSSKVRGFLDPMVESFRVIPPLALVALFALMFGIGDRTAVPLLIFASIWIMIIAARAGVRNVPLAKVRAAYSLGASPWQLLWRVIVPNALPEIFTGLRVALGVSWGTLVAAELFAIPDGLGAMIQQAKNFSRLDVIVVGIVIIAGIGVLMDGVIRLLDLEINLWKRIFL